MEADMMGEKKPDLVIAIGSKIKHKKRQGENDMDMGMENDEEDMEEMYKETAGEFMNAIKSDDKSAMWDAFKMLSEMAQHASEMDEGEY